MEQLAALIDIVKTQTTPYRPQCDGITERFNHTLGDMLRTITIDSPADWDKYLKPLCFAYNTAVHTTTGVQPFVMMYGRFPLLPADLIFNTEPVAHELTEGEYAREVCEGLRKVYDVVRKHSAFEVAKQKFFHDRRIKCAVYELNDRVYCRREAPPSKGVSKKLTPKYDGPYTIVERVTITDDKGGAIFNYRIRPDGKGRAKLVHASKLKKCFGPRVERAQQPRRGDASSQQQDEQATQSQTVTQQQQQQHVQREGTLANETGAGTRGSSRVEATALESIASAMQRVAPGTPIPTEGSSFDELNVEQYAPEEEASQYKPNYYYARREQQEEPQEDTRTRPQRERKTIQRYDASRK